MFEQLRHRHHAERECLCERFRNIYNNDDVRERSLCTWNYHADYNETRSPACVHKVVNCINTVHGTTNRCEMVKVSFPVQRKSGSRWLDERMEIPVACTLTSPLKRHISSTHDASVPYSTH